MSTSSWNKMHLGLPVCFVCVCETWSVILERKNQRFWVSENSAGDNTTKEEDVTYGWKILHSEELYDLYFAPE